MAMLLILRDLASRGECRLVGAAHLNHTIRPDAAADERFCRELCASIGVPLIARAADIPAIAASRGRSLEVAARLVRRQFLDEARAACGAHVVATAHTRDDQAETVLLRLLRGAGTRGMRGIEPMDGTRIRPLLCAARHELHDELRRRGQAWREDATNFDLANPRNRIRHELLPYLERHFNPSVGRALARLADAARADEALLARHAAAAAAVTIERAEGELRMSARALAALPDSLGRRIVQHALVSAGATRALSARLVEDVLELASGRRGGMEVGGVRVEMSRDELVFRPGARTSPAGFCAELPIPGRVVHEVAGWEISVEGPVPARDTLRGFVFSADTVAVAADELDGALVVRSRRPGDWLRPVGLGGRKKVQDLLVDRKVARVRRDHVPIVADRRGRIVWVAGVAVSEEFRAAADTNAVIILKLRRL